MTNTRTPSPEAGLTLLFLVPRDDSARRAASIANRERLAQESVGEEARKVSKASTTSTTADGISGVAAFAMLFASTLVLARATWRRTQEDLDAERSESLAPSSARPLAASSPRCCTSSAKGTCSSLQPT